MQNIYILVICGLCFQSVYIYIYINKVVYVYICKKNPWPKCFHMSVNRSEMPSFSMQAPF